MKTYVPAGMPSNQEAGASSQRNDESLPELSKDLPPIGPTVVLSISIRALVPDWDAAAVAVAMRMVDRLQVYEQYAAYWEARPQVRCMCSSHSHLMAFVGAF